MLLLVLVALLPALIVAGIYEIRGNHGGPSTQPCVPSNTAEGEAPATTSAGARRARQESCSELRWHYLARCPGDVQALSPSASPHPTRSADAPTKAQEAQAIAEAETWLRPNPSELAEMAKRCEVRFSIPALTEDQPPTVGDAEAQALSLSNGERALLQRTLNDLHAELRSFVTSAFAEGHLPSGRTSSLTFDAMLADIQARPESGYAEGKRRLARERAGLASPSGAAGHQPPGERLIRLWSRLGDDFERRLADGLGTERAHQLRSSPQALWMNRFAESGCAADP